MSLRWVRAAAGGRWAEVVVWVGVNREQCVEGGGRQCACVCLCACVCFFLCVCMNMWRVMRVISENREGG